MTVTTERPADVSLLASTASPRDAVERWVDGIAALAEPARIVWCDGSAAERERLLAEMVATGTLEKLSDDLRPGSYIARSAPSDVARVESRTFICSADEAEAGPNNNWRAPDVMRDELTTRFGGSMRGRTMYVVPFSMGPVGGVLSRLGVQVTDSPYVVVSTGTMTRMGTAALAEIDAGKKWVPAVHSVGMPLVDEHGAPLRHDDGSTVTDVPWPSNETKIIAHFPETREIWSFGSGYGGNAILAKKCFALRIASVMAREEGWLAEHMLLVRITSPKGRRTTIAAAFPSACGKTNFAMMQPSRPGWKVETIGDDITWLRPGSDGRLWAINPEAGLFGVAPGTSVATNPVAMDTIARDTIFTNVAVDPDGDVWWEGIGRDRPETLTDWQGRTVGRDDVGPAAHPNGRFTVSIDRVPTLADEWDAADGVPLDAIVLGGRRADTVPLVTEARDWQHGVFLGATMSSQRTAAAEGKVGELRFDPFAMQPFCGYDLGDHWAQWLAIGETLGAKAPRIFRVNWFQRDSEGSFVWPGFGENIRVVDWIVKRLHGEVSAIETPIGLLPYRHDLDLDGLDLSESELRGLLTVDLEGWYRETGAIQRHLAGYGARVPKAIVAELNKVRWGLWEWLRG